jgi:flagellar biosynthesis protein FliQ
MWHSKPDYWGWKVAYIAKPMSRKSVLEGLSVSWLADIQEQTLAIVFSIIAMFLINSEEAKEMRSCDMHVNSLVVIDSRINYYLVVLI